MPTLPAASVDLVLCDLPYGTTACVNTGRSFIGIEKDEKYFEIAKQRIEDRQRLLAEVLS